MRQGVAVAVRVDLADQFISLLDNVGESRNGRNVWRSVRSIVWWSGRFLGFALVLQNRTSLIEVCVRDKIVFSSTLRYFLDEVEEKWPASAGLLAPEIARILTDQITY